jgi:hypothetical protein
MKKITLIGISCLSIFVFMILFLPLQGFSQDESDSSDSSSGSKAVPQEDRSDNESSPSPSPPPPHNGRCLIATAAFGSEIAPEVQFLRNFRETYILHTHAGSNFMKVFNTWYYSFSPYVADYERHEPWLQQIVKTSIYPLLGILFVSERAYSVIPGEYGAIAAGLVASSMIGATYFLPLALTIKQIRKSTNVFVCKSTLSIILVVLLAVIGSLTASNQIVTMISTSILVLVTIAISAIFSARIVFKFISDISEKKRHYWIME